ncbi:MULTISPECIES: acyl-CoA dehydrogenase family protein [unclassified Mycobacterium]|uniref:acyl-CoA dehydrogenase family protein n=1 Tax=unclassified Mycobacterium TaxID=2642494 RepID=UPI00074000A2|nr:MULTISPECIES: acyl-CoA dehydrogenase family protein [unclassified Mycobacterium]KUH81053.1 acyl-CoA dehydrogenase [Mycobacterium sp. GA-1999]KUH84064.1 acyl-CoA dehydrogenase [Mycobacterium sp. IS-1556]KUH89929.1 acyl-CoA dehydrogenase [Mycobacterium sp. GA-0227b]
MTETPSAGVDPALVAMMDAVFAEHRGDPALWQQLDKLGLVRLTGPEDVGGSGAGWYEAAELLSAAARHGVRVPLAENDLLACWLLDAIGLPSTGTVRTVCLLDSYGTARGVPWAAGAQRVVVVWNAGGEHRAADVDIERLGITSGFNTVGEPRDTVTADISALDGVSVPAPLVTQLRLKSALVRSIQVCAALDRVVQMSVEHATSRIQFGRPLARFQAVQHLIADLTAEAALARAATEAALTTAVTTDWSGESLEFRVAAARSCAGHAAEVVVRNAHQVHGAIGTTQEHRLHEFTRAALAWRSEFGSVRYWDQRVTDAALAAGAAGLWSMVTG